MVGSLCLSLDHNLYHLMLPDHKAWTAPLRIQSRLAPLVAWGGPEECMAVCCSHQGSPAHPVVHQHACAAFVMHIVCYQELEYATHDCVHAYVVYYVKCIYMR